MVLTKAKIEDSSPVLDVKQRVCLTYLIWKNTRQVIYRCNSNTSLVLVWQTLHDVFHCHSIFLRGRRLSHKGGRIWRETKWIHLREIDSCVLTWAGEDDDCEQVDELVSSFHRCREAVITFAFPDWITILMEIENPCLKLGVLGIAKHQC